MEQIPVMFECTYCKRSSGHGGQCEGKRNRDQGCLYFQLDEKGCIRREDIKIPFNLYDEIPPLNTWCDRWVLYDNPTQIKIIRIKGLNWDKQKGLLYVYADCEFYVNEFCDGYIEHKNKPKLRVVK